MYFVIFSINKKKKLFNMCQFKRKTIKLLLNRFKASLDLLKDSEKLRLIPSNFDFFSTFFLLKL